MYKNYLKRIMDFLCSLLGLIVLAPVFIVIAVLIKISSKGPVFFFQERLGKNGRVFKIIKFRTMVINAENQGDGLFVFDEDDERITKFGKLLRKTSLDELPQLINVLVGDMSLVGPRPPVTYHPYRIEEYDTNKLKRFEVRPGITGLAQVKLRNSGTWDDRIKLDLIYVDKISFLMDMRILLLTIISVFKRKNIFISGANEKCLAGQRKISPK